MTMTLYRCRLPPDLFPYIVEAISEDRKARSTLVALAATCWAFHGPAIAVLWKSQRNLVNLMMTMPEDVLSAGPSEMIPPAGGFSSAESESQDKRSAPESPDRLSCSKPQNGPTVLYLIFKRQPLPEDWHRFDYYASRIRTFTNSSVAPKHKTGAPIYLSAHVRKVLAERAAACALLPNLRRFIWNLDTEQLQFYYFFYNLVGPKLLHFSIETKSETNINIKVSDSHYHSMIDGMLGHAAEVASDLVQLDLDFRWVGWQDASKDFPNHLPSMQNLRILTLSGSYKRSTLQNGLFFSYRMLQRLPLLPNLQKLHIDMVAPHWEDLEARSIALSTLKILEFYRVDLRAMVQIARAIQAPRLESAAFLHAYPLSAWEGFSEITAALCYEPPLLRSITFINDSDWDRPYMDMKSFRPLLAVDTLEEVVFDTQNLKSKCTDRDILAMATSWPHLRRFVLKSMSSRISLVGLKYLVASCPNLKDLTIMMELNPVLLTSGALTGGPVNVHITQLDLNSSYVRSHAGKADVGVLAEFLLAMFPNALVLKTQRMHVQHLRNAFQRRLAARKLALGKLYA